MAIHRLRAPLSIALLAALVAPVLPLAARSAAGTALAAPTTYLVDGFESGNLQTWTATGNGSAVVQSTTVNSGTYAAALTNASGQYIGLHANLSGGGQSLTYSRFCFNLSGISGAIVLAQAKDVNGNNLWEVDYDAGSKGLDIYFWNGARTRSDLYSPANLLLANTWYCAEVEANETSTGSGQVWLNGTSVGTVSGDLSATNPISQLYLWNNAAVGTVYMDDIQVSNAYNGPVGAGTGSLPAPNVSLSPTSLTFSSQAITTTSGAQTITLTNSGNAPLTISSIGLTGTNSSDFAQTNTCPLSPGKLSAGANCTISVTFTPSATGGRGATLSITDNAGGSPHTVSLSGTGTAPSASLSPTSLTFSSQTVNTSSSGQSVTLTNGGTAPLSISSIGFTGTNPGDFAQSTTCPMSPSTLAASSSCTITVTFTPTTTGVRSASLSIADTASGSPHTAAVSGTGSFPAGTYLSDGFENGLGIWTTTGNGSASVQSTTVNSGASAAALTNVSGQVIGLHASLSGGGQTLTYSRICFNLSNLSGTTVLAQAKDVNGNTLWEVDYDNGSKGLDVYFWNAARTRSDLYSPANLLTANTWYCAEVEANETSTGTGQVWLNGTSVGTVNADLSVTNPISQLYLWNNGAAGTVYMDDIQVSNAYNGPVGAGATPLPAPKVSLSPTGLTFSSQATNTTSAGQTITLTNSGNAALTIGSIVISGMADFAQTNTCPLGPGTLAAAASCTVSVSFTPMATGPRSGSLIITDNAGGTAPGGSQQSVSLSGTGSVPVVPVVSLSQSSLSFASQAVNSTSTAQSVTLTNTGNAPLSISGISVTGTNSGDFTQTNTCPVSPSTLAAGASCAISVTFAPSAAGSRSAGISIADNAGGSPQTVSLTGAGSFPAGTYLSDGFERGLSAWSTVGNGSISVESTTVNSGAQAAALTNASGQYVGLHASLSGGGQTLTYSRFCFNLSGITGSFILAQAKDVNGQSRWEIDYDAGRSSLDVYFWNGAGSRTDLYGAANLIAANTWYCAEVQANEASAGTGQVWLNGTSMGSVSADLSATTPYSQLFLWNNAAVGTVYMDDARVTNSYNGPVGAAAPALTITASSASMAYGGSPPSITPSYTGLKNGATAPATPPTCGVVDSNNNPVTLSSTTPAGTYTTVCSGAVDPNYRISYQSGKLTINAAPASVKSATSNAGPFAVSSAGGTASVPLSATLTAGQGDLTSATVTFTLTPVGSGGTTYSCTVTTTGGQLSAVAGSGSACSSPTMSGSPLAVGCTFTGVAVNVYQLTVTVSGNYTAAPATGAVTVYDPSLGATVGGGMLTRTENNVAVPVTIGFLANTVNGAVQGSVLYIEHRPSGDVIQQATSPGVTSLTIVPGTGTQVTAFIQGTWTVQGVSGYHFAIKAIDANSTGASTNPDQLGLQVTDPSGTVYSDLTFNGIALSSGDLIVP